MISRRYEVSIGEATVPRLTLRHFFLLYSIIYIYATAELGRNPVSKHQIQPEYGDEQADTGRDCRTHLARPILWHERGQGNIYFSCSADHVQDWQPYQVDPYTLAIFVTINILYINHSQYWAI